MKTNPPSRSLSPVLWLGLLALLLVALALRVPGIVSRTLWQDEGLTFYQIQQSIPAVLAGGIEVQGLMTRNTHPPLYFLLLALFGRLAGYGDFAVRWFSIGWSVLAVPLVFAFGRRLGGRPVGGVAALLVALSPLFLWYAQEIRMYSMVVFLSTLSTYRFWVALTTGRRRAYALYALATAALLWTHFSAFFLVAVQGAILVLFIGRRHWKALLAVGAALLLAAAPFVPFVWARLRSGQERDFHFVPLETIARDLLHSFTTGLTMPIEGIFRFDLLVAALVLGGVAWLAQRGRGRGVRWLAGPLLLALLALPPLLLYALSYVKPLYQNVRHLIVVAPAFYLLAAAGLVGLWRWRWRGTPAGAALAAVLALGWALTAGVSTVNYYTNPKYAKDDTRGLFAYIAANFRPGDLVVLNDAVLSHILMHEQPDLPWTALPHYGTQSIWPQAREQFTQTLAAADRFWFVYSPGDSTHDRARLIDQWFRDEAMALDDRQFRGLTVGLGVAYYDPHGAIARAPQPVTDPLGASFARALDLHGAVVGQREVVAGQKLPLDLVWFVREQPTTDYKVSLRLRDAAGTVWAAGDQFPFPQVHPTSHWIAGDYLRSPHLLPIPPGTPPGDYELLVGLYDATTGSPLPRSEGGELVHLGTVAVRPAAAPTGWQPPQPRVATIGDALRLQGTDLPQRVRVGEMFTAELFVTAARDLPPEALPRLRLELVDGADRLAAQTEAPLPTAAPLPAGSLLRARLPLTVAPTAAPGDYRLRAIFLDGTGRPLPVGTWWGLRHAPTATLGSLTVEDRPRRFDLPEIGQPVGGEWAQGVRLIAADLPASGQPGSLLPLALVWQASGPTDARYKVFAHLRDATNGTAAQADFLPGGGAAPSEGWAPGEVIVDEEAIWLPDDLPPGRYRLVVGLYVEASGARLPVAGATADEFEVGSVEITVP